MEHQRGFVFPERFSDVCLPDQLLRVFSALFFMNFSAHDAAAEDVHDHVKVVADPANRRRQKGHVPSPYWGCGRFLDYYAAGSKAFRYSSGLFAPNDILILFPLYQYKYSFNVFMNSSMLTPNHFLL